MKPSCAVCIGHAAKLSRKSVLEITGPDTQKFLKGLTCKDVESLQGGYSGFLSAAGRVLHDVFIFPVEKDRYLITHEADHPFPLQKYLAPFKLRSKVRFKDVSADWRTWGVWGSNPDPKPERAWKLGSLGAAEASWSWPNGTAKIAGIGCWDLRVGRGQQLLLPPGQDPDVNVSTETEYHLQRMRLGVPEGPRELIPDVALPLESCMDVHGGLDVRKGCYVGQELTVRTYHTGATRKRILPLRLFPLDQSLPTDFLDLPAQAPGAIGDVLYHPPSTSATKKPKSAGRVLSLHSAYGTLGLGLLRLEMVDRTWSQPTSIEEWVNGTSARLTTNMGGKDYGVYVGKGEAYAASLDAL